MQKKIVNGSIKQACPQQAKKEKNERTLNQYIINN